MKSKAKNIGLWLKKNVFSLIILAVLTGYFVFINVCIAGNFDKTIVSIGSIVVLSLVVIVYLTPIVTALYKIIKSKDKPYVPYTSMELFIKIIATTGLVFAYHILTSFVYIFTIF